MAIYIKVKERDWAEVYIDRLIDRVYFAFIFLFFGKTTVKFQYVYREELNDKT